MNFRKLFNIFPPEEISFIFPGKIGRNLSSWQNGEWIITTKRAIFVAEGFDSPDKPVFGRPMALIILLDEIVNVQKKKTKLVLKYSTYDLFLKHYDIKKINIGFLKQDFRNYKVAQRSELMNLIYLFLKTPKKSLYNSCPTCGSNVPENETECLTCNSDFPKCEICNYPIVDPEDKTRCPICKSYFHKREFLEWIKVHGQCPNCQYDLKQLNVVQSVPVDPNRANLRIVSE